MMFYEKELVIDGTKYIRGDRAVDYVRELEEKLGENILKSLIDDRYKMTYEEFNSVADLFDTEYGKYTQIENATLHVLNKEQFKLINKIINCYYDVAYARIENTLAELEEETK